MIHLKRFGIGLLWGMSTTLMTVAMVKFPIPVMIGSALVVMYAVGMLFLK